MTVNNDITDRCYLSKIILLGEYCVIHDGEILAAPLSLHSAQWEKDKPVFERLQGLQMVLDYLRNTNNKVIDTDRFAHSIKEGLYFRSDIPSGYGLGSSGAITAGIYDRFAYVDQKQIDTALLKQDLINIESCFHGVSSGIDPLVIYLDKCVHIDHLGIHVINEPIDLSHYFLIDTMQARKTAEYVDQYMKRSKKDSYLSEVDKYKSMVSKAIQYQLKSDNTLLSTSICEISQWQYQHLDFAILEDYRELWRSTLNMDHISIKLCGAGGGGYLLGYALDIDQALSHFRNYKVLRLG